MSLMKTQCTQRVDYLESAIDFAVLHEVAPVDALVLVTSTCIDIFCQVQANMPEANSLAPCAGGILLEDLKDNPGFMQHAIAVNGQAHWDVLFVIVGNLVVSDLAFVCAPAVLGC